MYSEEFATVVSLGAISEAPVKYGQIWYIKTQESKGSIQGGTRPVIIVYDDVKYYSESVKAAELCYKDVSSMEVKTMSKEEAWKLGFDETDCFDEYVVFHFGNGGESTFRNSYVDVFKA